MDKRSKDLLRTLVTQLRHTLLGTWDEAGERLRGDLDRELERLGVAPDGSLTPLDALPNATTTERRARRVAEAQLSGLPAEERPAARQEIVERAGYTWINRLLALRAMEARGLIDETLRANPAYDGLSEALYILRQTRPDRVSGADGGWWAVVEDACRAQAEALPGLFDLDDPNAALRPSTPALLSCVALVGGRLSGCTPEESDASFADPDAIGWAYQFYQQEAKDRTYAKLSAGGKVETRAEIAAVTQLFTEPYMVRWLLQNSLGRSYHEMYPDSKLPETWEYYIRPGELQPRTVGERGPCSLEELTLMDPCMGSGHFLREGFDVLAAMYHERYPGMGAREVADAVLGRHLHGIDIDPRAAQLAALTLYLRAWELLRDERRAQRLPGPGSYMTPTLNVATTPTGLTSGALKRHLERHPEDQVFEPLLRAVFGALEQAQILGSLLQTSEHLDEAIQEFRGQTRGQLGLLPEHASLNRLLEELGTHDPVELKRVLVERVAHSFSAEAASTDDVSAAVFGREANEGLNLLGLLDRRYAVVATNPPYMGGRSANSTLKQYLGQWYTIGNRDLYSAFILRCRELCRPGGRVAMVTQQSWMFLRGFVDLRAVSDDRKRSLKHRQSAFRGLLRDTTIERLAHLGPNAFEEISGEVVSSVLFIFKSSIPQGEHKLRGYRLVGLKQASEKAEALASFGSCPSEHGMVFSVAQSSFLSIPDAPVVYWLGPSLLAALGASTRFQSAVVVLEGLHTGDNRRFVRYSWEVCDPSLSRWLPYQKAGGYRKWHGLNLYAVDWQEAGTRVKAFNASAPGGRILGESHYLHPGLTYSFLASGSMSMRVMGHGEVFDSASYGVFPLDESKTYAVLGIFNSAAATFLLRASSQSLRFNKGYVESLPLPQDLCEFEREIAEAAEWCHAAKQWLCRQDIVERDFMLTSHPQTVVRLLIEALLHTAETFVSRSADGAFGVSNEDARQVRSETGIPVGENPVLCGYGSLPDIIELHGLPSLPHAVRSYFREAEGFDFGQEDIRRIKSALRVIYEAGPHAGDIELGADLPAELDDVGSEVVGGGYLPVPAETFLEEVSQKLKIHPISIYWLLEELHAEGVRCKPEERRILEDRLSVLVLHLLGHRWPVQIEAGVPVPNWADADGVIPLTAGTGETPLSERLRARLRAEDGALGAQQAEASLQELTGQDLETWLQRSFFPRHVRQFKHRPIAWHLTSMPRGGRRRRGRRPPAFECLLYYHACGGDELARLRSHYLEETLLYAERRQMERARKAGDETAAAQATERIQELEEFAGRLRQVEEEGFACAELEEYVQNESLDRWIGDGVFPPASRGELLANEQGWHADINDGVRVDIAPLQRAGLLASDVLSAKDMRKAIADRARWRADERRWVREGVLPRCGWLDESVPEGPRWTERAPEREAERQKLEDKRQKLEDKRRALTERLAGVQEAAE